MVVRCSREEENDFLFRLEKAEQRDSNRFRSGSSDIMQFRAVAAAHSGTSDANWETRCKAVAQLAEQNDANNREAMQRIEQHMELHSKQQKAKQTAAPRQHHQGSHTSIRVQAAPGGQSSFKLVDGSAHSPRASNSRRAASPRRSPMSPLPSPRAAGRRTCSTPHGSLAQRGCSPMSSIHLG
mmetsp:Transcript_5526/g.9272  ORF Transcript_5526/g.9272 Transcript_5526/m.9272 type:complete len:182 (-) Transcript_5526:144-689(-)